MESVKALSARSLQYYAIGRQWQSDLEFFKVETAFLHRLLDDYFIPLSNEIYLNRLKKAGENLFRLEEDESRMEILLNSQLRELELMAEDMIAEDAEQLSGTQVELEYMIAGLAKAYREVKQELFSLIECLIKDRKMLTA
ncbi:hypothetical protein MUY27_07605 [Mucilaginibacter sp. RS28]|uniref:Uncharacterized protein n=1 Tax=Mucilaginibacter straminoryzae TaxID=2932774 RepID=A0A9X1X3F1_9SPHI|nr:hypothetical protein [Mucilaginibacter straminoryzae]MCJ8209570.1 hypothetical protein [Mucilaginibacter straminoryzae]